MWITIYTDSRCANSKHELGGKSKNDCYYWDSSFTDGITTANELSQSPAFTHQTLVYSSSRVNLLAAFVQICYKYVACS